MGTKMLESDIILTLAKEVRKDFPRMGANKLLLYLRPNLSKMGLDIGRDAFASLLSENRMLVKRKRSKRKTTFSKHRFYKYPNLIRNYMPTAPNQLWVSDITYIEVGYGFVYLSLITDAYSRKIVGWNLARDLSTGNALKALKQALTTLPSGSSLIHHSDRGVQYCSVAYVKELESRNILISMTENGDQLENAIAERVNGILKNEWIDKYHLETWNNALSYVEKIIGLYNNERPHQSLSYLTPSLVHQTGIETQRKWKNYYPMKKESEIIINSRPDLPCCQDVSGYEAKMPENVNPC
jgi:transposase InsO family protein